jgi:enamine deaminase RidA (YjgF/YER057c/UK114 family)
MNAVYRRRLKDPYPARSTITVAALANPAYRIEVDDIAIAGKGTAPHG